MSKCNHVWRDTPYPKPKENKMELLDSVKSAGVKGWRLKGDEFIFALSLIEDGEIKYCDKCPHNKAVLVIKKGLRN